MKILSLILPVAVALAASAARAADHQSDTVSLSWSETAAEIDRLFVSAWQREQIEPAAPASDEEFIRRIYLDLAGRVPAVAEAREFLDSQDSNRRANVVEQLLQDPAYVRHMTIVWRNALIPQAASQPEFRGLVPGFDAWLWERLATNVPYDQLVREIITSDVMSRGQVPSTTATETVTADAFFAVRELMPESLAAGTSRVFLGVRLDCAQCHDHPFDSWKQEQFWNLAAFYAGFARDEDDAAMQPVSEKLDQRSIRIAGTDEFAEAVFLTGESAPADGRPARQQLADWIVGRDNPWFAKMAANRLWAAFFGQGIVSPTDDFSEDNPPSHPEVLTLLADQLVAHDFDLAFLIRSITATQTYQRSSVQSDPSQADPVMFARAFVRGLTPEQFFDSLAEAVGFYQPYRSENPFVVDNSSPRGRFIELFRNDAESALEHRSTILQGLAMMNGEFVADATSLEESRTLRAVADFPLMSDDERLETLFLASLSRRPTANERTVFLEHLHSATAGSSQVALGDVFWALLNSSEFLLNH